MMCIYSLRYICVYLCVCMSFNEDGNKIKITMSRYICTHTSLYTYANIHSICMYAFTWFIYLV